MAQSELIAALAQALCEAQFELESAKKDRENPHFRSKYADLTSVWDACRPALHKNGLAVVQAPEPSDTGIKLRTVLIHKSGEWIDGTLTLPAIKQDPQAYGSAMSYARRYGLAALIGIVADDDDDGHEASQPKQSNGAASYDRPAAHTNGNGSAPGKATEPQTKALFGIWKSAGFEGTLQDWIKESYGCAVNDLTKAQASAAIEALKEQEPA